MLFQSHGQLEWKTGYSQYCIDLIISAGRQLNADISIQCNLDKKTHRSNDKIDNNSAHSGHY